MVGSCIYDLICFVPRLPAPGETLLADRGERRLGGKGLNQAVALARLGCSVTFAAGLGDDALASAFVAFTERERIDFVAGYGAAPTGVGVPIVTPDGDSTIVVDAGAAMQLGAGVVMAVLDRHRWDGVLFHYEVPVDTLRLLAAATRERGIPLFCNPAPWIADGGLELANQADFVILNEQEARHLVAAVGHPAVPGSRPELATAAAAALSAKLVVMTVGDAGSIAVQDGQPVPCDGRPVQVVDATGAGDAFCAGVTYSVLSGRSVADSLALATLAAGIVCGRVGGADAMPTMAELDTALVLRHGH